MSAIGGVVNLEGQGIATSVVLDMSRAMLGRAKEQRGAYLTKRAGLFHNRSLGWESEAARQPRTATKKGKHVTVVLDGYPLGRDPQAGLERSLGLESAAELVLEYYLAFGASFLGSLSGAFAVAIYDEERGELLLARDREGRCPLFYAVEDGTLAFASEIKALLRFLPGAAEIDGEALRAHWRASCGECAGETLYREIRAIPPGHCGIYSRMGMSVYAYEAEPIPREEARDGGQITPRLICPCETGLRDILTQAVFAFDYPQFDYLMPGFFQALDELNQQKKRTATVEDGTLYMNLGYAYERADRLGAMKGVTVTPAVPASFSLRQRELKKMDRLLRDLVAEGDGARLSRLFGEGWQEMVSEEKNLAKRIRMQGILYQTGIWMEHYRLAVV
ncbi:MAG: hypothetical protein IJW44_02940 [Clostridia bacterium]|nr:hypothetical protein [Clostridia bacterium]